jgi:hypothetical protein
VVSIAELVHIYLINDKAGIWKAFSALSNKYGQRLPKVEQFSNMQKMFSL